MSKFYVNIRGRNHISRTNIAGCQTECGITLEVGQALTVSTPAEVCQRCEQSSAFTGVGPMSLPHYLEAENEALRAIIDGAALVLEENKFPTVAETLRRQVREARR